MRLIYCRSIRLPPMESNRKQNKRDEIISDCRSLGSTHRPCSQSRKMSIGVVVDSQPKIKPGTAREDVIQNAKIPPKENSKEDRHRRNSIASPNRHKQAGDPEPHAFPWVSTRSFSQNEPTSEKITRTYNGKDSRLNGEKEPTETYDIGLFSNQMSILQSSDGKKKKLQRVSYKQNTGRTDAAEGVEEFSFAAAEEVLVQQEDAVAKSDKTENRGSVILRLKLQEILGSVSSLHKPVSDSQTPDIGANSLIKDKKSDRKGNAVAKSITSSESIESDSENPDNTSRRPVTRSLTRKRAKLQPKRNGIVKPSILESQLKKNECMISSFHKLQTLPKSIFSFEEGLFRSSRGAFKGGFSTPKEVKNEKLNSRTEPRQTPSPNERGEGEIQRQTNKSRKKILDAKLSSIGTRRGCNRSSPLGTSENVKPINGVQKHFCHKFDEKKIADELGDVEGMTGLHDMDQEDRVNLSSKKTVDTNHDLKSPESRLRTHSNILFPDSVPKPSHEDLADNTPIGKASDMEDVLNIRNFFTSELDFRKEKVPLEPSDDTEEPDDSPSLPSEPVMKRKDMKERLPKSSYEEADVDHSLSNSPSEETDSETSEDCYLYKGHPLGRG